MSKYRNIKQRCLLGHNHDSKLEASYCNRLRTLARSGKISGFWVQKKYPLCVVGIKICDHIVDFLVAYKDGHTEVHETKGFMTAVWRIKVKLFRAIYPQIPYYIVEK